MAYSSSKGFRYWKKIGPNAEDPQRIEVTLASSTGVALTVGDAVQYTAGYLTIAGTGESILGILEGFVTESGESIFKTKETLAGTKSGDDTYTPGAGETVKGIVNVDPMALFFNEADSSLGQAEVGLYFDTTATSDQITGAGSGTQSQFQLIELVTTDMSGATQNDCGLFRIVESQLYNAAAA
jgi:hypothetical protein